MRRRWMHLNTQHQLISFRTMEDASGVDLDWFWRGWFYTTDYNDIGIKDVKKFYLTDQPTQAAKDQAKRFNIDLEGEYKGKLVFFAEQKEGSEVKGKKAMDLDVIKNHIAKMADDEKARLKKLQITSMKLLLKNQEVWLCQLLSN